MQISIGTGAGGWVAYGILIILALVYLALLLMLLVKLLEAVVRIAGRIGFDRSRHVVDSGLLGACGLLGCCGSRQRHRRRRSRKHKYQPTNTPPQPQHRDSDMSSYLPPNPPGNIDTGAVTPPKFPGNGSSSRKGSTHSGPPPSVLRPEHALRPYKEDSDDEGFIMGAWQPFPRAGYVPVFDQPMTASPLSYNQKPSPSTTTVVPSGFSRVGGGRAHIDTPYAIRSGSTHTFPSIGQQSAATLSPAVFADGDDSPPPSVSNVGIGGLPPGAMQPAHIRTKSQTAIVEDAGTLLGTVASGSSSPPLSKRAQKANSGGLLRPPALTPDAFDDDDSEDQSQPKKKPWYRIRRHRPHSSDGMPSSSLSASPAPVDVEMGGVGAEAAQPSRSFVVIRKPQLSTGRSNPSSVGARPSSVTNTPTL